MNIQKPFQQNFIQSIMDELIDNNISESFFSKLFVSIVNQIAAFE